MGFQWRCGAGHDKQAAGFDGKGSGKGELGVGERRMLPADRTVVKSAGCGVPGEGMSGGGG